MWLLAAAAVVVGFRQLLSAGLERRRQLGDLEFSNRYAEFLRSRAKHSSICAFLQRMQGFKKRWVPPPPPRPPRSTRRARQVGLP